MNVLKHTVKAYLWGHLQHEYTRTKNSVDVSHAPFVFCAAARSAGKRQFMSWDGIVRIGLILRDLSCHVIGGNCQGLV